MHPTQAALVIDCGSLASTVAKATASLRTSSLECPSPAGVHALHFPAEGTLRRVEATHCQVKGTLRRLEATLCQVKGALRRAKVALYNVNVAPRSGDAPVRLMWSLMSTGVPGFQVSRMPPAPFVRIMVVAPVAAAVRTEWTTRRTPCCS